MVAWLNVGCFLFWKALDNIDLNQMSQMLHNRDFYTVVNVWKIQISRGTLVQSACHCWKILLSVSVKLNIIKRVIVAISYAF